MKKISLVPEENVVFKTESTLYFRKDGKVFRGNCKRKKMFVQTESVKQVIAIAKTSTTRLIERMKREGIGIRK